MIDSFALDLIESLKEAADHANGGSMVNSRERIVEVSAKGAAGPENVEIVDYH